MPALPEAPAPEQSAPGNGRRARRATVAEAPAAPELPALPAAPSAPAPSVPATPATEWPEAQGSARRPRGVVESTPRPSAIVDPRRLPRPPRRRSRNPWPSSRR